LQIQAKSRWR